MPQKGRNILKYNHGERSRKDPFVIYPDMQSLLKKIDACHSNLEKSSITKINKHTASGYSLFMYCSFNVTKNKHDYYRNKDYMIFFSNDLKHHATKIINCEERRNGSINR